jgi:hypothetical protein
MSIFCASEAFLISAGERTIRYPLPVSSERDLMVSRDFLIIKDNLECHPYPFSGRSNDFSGDFDHHPMGVGQRYGHRYFLPDGQLPIRL